MQLESSALATMGETMLLFPHIVVAIILLLPSTAEKPGPFMQIGGVTTQPRGHNLFCKNHPQECAPATTHESRVRLTQALRDELVSVNAETNAQITPTPDWKHHGWEELWSYPEVQGDCEDFALLKRLKLIEKGWPADALLITVGRQKNGEGHAVLTVLTDQGDLVLDNLQETILVWYETPYFYVKRQSETHFGQWKKIVGARTLPD